MLHLPVMLFLVCRFLFVPANGPGDPLPTQGQSTNDKTILFSGYEWKVRNTEVAQGPGPNYFSEKSVWVDKKGFLHLTIRKDSASGKWLCAEITSLESFGFGTYAFSIEGAIDRFDKNTVLGLFNYSGNDGLDELDIEFARWGNDRYPNLNYTVWPASHAFKNTSYTKEYQQAGSYSNQQFVWTKDSVIFSTFNGNEIDSKTQVAGFSCTQPPSSISSVPMPVHMNLWLFDGHAPGDGKAVEVVVHSFGYYQ